MVSSSMRLWTMRPRMHLRRPGTRGWVPVIVTNGTTRQQEAKITAVGLDEIVAGWVISEAAGFAKPDREIFRIAARLVDLSLSDAWMLGDNPEKDIAGATALGIRTVWLARGRHWPHATFGPSFVADGPAEAIEHVLRGSRA